MPWNMILSKMLKDLSNFTLLMIWTSFRAVWEMFLKWVAPFSRQMLKRINIGWVIMYLLNQLTWLCLSSKLSTKTSLLNLRTTRWYGNTNTHKKNLYQPGCLFPLKDMLPWDVSSSLEEKIPLLQVAKQLTVWSVSTNLQLLLDRLLRRLYGAMLVLLEVKAAVYGL